MKKFRIYTFLLVFVMGLFSCDGYLDDPLENRDSTDDTDYTQTENMNSILVGAYQKLYSLQWETFPLLAVRGDDVNAAGDQAPLTETDYFRYDRSFWMYNSTWLNFYSDIISFHAAIEEIEKYQEFAPNPVQGDQYQAQIRVMIGFEMLQLERLWGDLIIPTSSQANELFEKPVVPREEVLQYIIDEMDAAIPMLQSVHPNQLSSIPGGITQFTALAVKAMAHLELEDYSGVAEATGQIISSNLFELEEDYYQLFKIPGKLNDENILELQYSDFNQGAGASSNYLNAFFGPTGQGWEPAKEGVSPGWGFWEPSISYVKFMLERGEELRLETSVLFTPDGMDTIMTDPNFPTLPAWISNETRDGDVINNYARALFVSGKHYLPSIQNIDGRAGYGSNKNFICIRYAEILLMHAEALVNGASSTVLSADDAVNLVRNRAGLDPLSGVTLQDVLDEKFAEFGMEWGIRFYDLVRHDMPGPLNYEGRNYNEDTDRFLPYPLQQQDLLPQLKDADNNGS